MIILLSSNIISGAYTVLEIVLAVLLTQLLTSIAGIMNVKAIYEDRQKLSLKSSKIPAISDPGLTTPRIHFAAALTSVLVTLLLTTGQFGIVGVTEKEYKEVTVKYLVSKSPSGYHLNVQDHISMERKKVSKEILLLEQTLYCSQGTSTFLELYAYIYDGDDIERPVNDPHSALDITCVTDDSGFEKKIAHVLHGSYPSYDGILQCQFSANTREIPWRKVTNTSIEATCQWAVREAWCYKDTFVYCTAALEYSGLYALATFWEVSNGLFDIQARFWPDGEEFGTEKLKAGALLMAVGLTNIAGLMYMLSSWVERNATVRKIINPSRQATRIHVPLLSATLVPSVIILLFTGCTAFYMWRKVILVPKRQGYNRFNSAADLLSCAAVEKFQDGGCRYRRAGVISVGLDECGEYASPVKIDC